MTIGKKLYWGFGLVLILVTVVSLITLSVMGYERVSVQRMQTLFAAQRTTSEISTRMMENHQKMDYYLLSGVPQALVEVQKGQAELESKLTNLIAASTDADVKDNLKRVLDTEKRWKIEFVEPLIEKRKQVDSGNMTVDQLQLFYFGLHPDERLKQSQEPVNDSMAAIKRVVDAQESTRQTAANTVLAVSILGLFATIAGGLLIAYKISQQITQPLSDLIGVARQIGDSGDLNQTVGITSEDEIGELAKTFNNMVSYLREMAGVSEAIAGGDLTVDVQARSAKDTLAIAFTEMTHGLRNMVKSVRDGASQVASGSNQVASASDESAR